VNRPAAGVLLGVNILWIPLAFLSDGLTVLVLPLRLGADAAAIGLVSLVGLLAAAVMQPLAGWASDRLRGRLDRRAFLTAAAIPVVLGLLLVGGPAAPAVAVAGYLVIQVAAAALQAAHQALLPEHVAARGRGRASGLKTTFDVGGSFLAFLLLGALLAPGAGSVAGSTVLIATLVAGAVAIVWLLVPTAVPTGVTPPLRSGRMAVPAGLIPLVFARFLFLLGTYAVGRFLLLLVAERLGIDPMTAADETGGLLAAFTLATAAAALGFGWIADRRPRRDVMVLGAMVATAGIVALVPAAGIAGVVAGGLLMSVGTAAFMSANWAATADLTSPDDAGRLLGIANVGTAGAAAAAGALGFLIEAAGFTPALLLAAIASFASAAPLLAGQVPRLAEMEGAR
jgi:MFS family permease